MGIFTRFRDIISSNINAMLDNAEDPQKLIKLMIQEMEDTLVEMKSSCASVMALCKRVNRSLERAHAQERLWEERAKLAVAKGQDDLAREALLEKRRYARMAEGLNQEMSGHSSLVEGYQDDIRQLEDKLRGAREKQRLLVQRHIRARGKKRVQQDLRRMDSSEAILRFDKLENRIERMEAEADLVNFGRKPTLEEKFKTLLVDDDIEKELQALKSLPEAKKEDRPAS